MKKKNIIWITIDGVRPHNKCKDVHDYPKIYNLVSKEFVEFTKVVTSAPSTVMSVSSIMASYPAFYLSRTFYSFNFDEKEFDSLPHILKKQGYDIFGIIAYHEIRKFLSGLFGDFCKSYWPKKINPFVYAWSGEEVNKIAFSLLKKRITKKPFFLYIHYKKLPHTSNNILKLISLLKKLRLYQDSIFILSSDHGYTDKKPDSKLKGIVTSHDMMMDENSFYVPLLIKYPGLVPKKINKQISTLDTTPTIIDILGMKSTDFKFKGISLLDLINNKKSGKYDNRYFRTDNRYIFQPSRVTSIKGIQYKYLFSYDTQEEEFYDVLNDPSEKKDLINDQRIIKTISRFRKEFNLQEKNALEFHKKYLILKFKEIVKNQNLKNVKNVYLTNTGSELFKKILIESIFQEFPQTDINNKRKKTDLAIVHLINKTGIGYKKTFKRLKIIKPKKTIFIDYNMDLCRKPNLFRYSLNHLHDNLSFYIYTPRSFATWFIRLISKKMKGKDIHKSLK